MKKPFITLLTGLLAAITFLLTWGCGHQTSTTDGFDTLGIETDSLIRSQKIRGTDSETTYRLVVDKPISGTYKDAATKAVICLLTFNDSLAGNDIDATMKAHADSFFVTTDDEEIDTPRSYDGMIKLHCQTPRYATFYVMDYCYLGGAHGSTNELYATVAWNTGKLLTWDELFPANAVQQLSSILQKALKTQYYKTNTPGYVELDGVSHFALPTMPPALTPQGIIFCWGEYEIDCYAAGRPQCTIPYAEIRDLMTEQARALIE